MVVDVFVMPTIERPIALTIGRYHNYKPVRSKQKRGFDSGGPKPGRLEDISTMFDEIGVTGEVSACLAEEVDRFLEQEEPLLRRALTARD